MEPIIKIEDIAYVRFAAPDLVQMQSFLEDFGLSCFEKDGALYGKGTDGRPFLHSTAKGEPAFTALGLQAESLNDLKKLSKRLDVPVTNLDRPGGGKVVTLTDPDGYKVEIVADQNEGASAGTVADHLRNNSTERPRIRSSVRLDPGPSTVHRLGHCVLSVSDFKVSEAWYKKRFGFLTSDEIEAAPDQPMGAFMRCDRGDKPTDHHTIFLAQLPGPPNFLHAAFEVANLDDLMRGHNYLKDKHRNQSWGVGRHIMGSQIFDYWRDPWGHELEHWTDGDLFNAEDAPIKNTLESVFAVQWGAPFPGFPEPEA